MALVTAVVSEVPIWLLCRFRNRAKFRNRFELDVGDLGGAPMRGLVSAAADRVEVAGLFRLNLGKRKVCFDLDGVDLPLIALTDLTRLSEDDCTTSSSLAIVAFVDWLVMVRIIES